ncbi:hypothetical protein [Oceanirhabdus sp. W0125-5]|uniref:hypothetical protein n=1 Tax=Oceanirhabdus sp. W0125-5 TaxID=2999116 RepID=UPI0022F2C38C|nr:hypothetical protein [Oceanirhabdus sp. W0125-5]WBW96767.1 hypothetical protein OW730_24205 [Oceanirhabdus sp. W0125-5]
MQNINSTGLSLNLPLDGYTAKITTPLSCIEILSPAEIKLIEICCNTFKLKIQTDEFKIVTLVKSLILEVYNPDGVMIIQITTPCKKTELKMEN